jgi:hypothetical protein
MDSVTTITGSMASVFWKETGRHRKLEIPKKIYHSCCWANENWTESGDGGIKDVLLLQEYSEEMMI